MARKKKSFSPFKMWFAWVGLFLGIIVAWMIPIQGNFPDSSLDDFSIFQLIFEGIGFSSMGITSLISYTAIGAVAGFLIGWAIHSLIRKMKK